VAEGCRALGFKDEGHMFEPTSEHCVVFLGKTLCFDFLSPPRCINGYLILFRIGERQRQRGRGDGRRPHYAGPLKSETLYISLTYDHLVMVIPLPFTLI